MSDEARTSDAWQTAHEVRAKANDLAQQAAKAAADAAEAEARATADEEGVDYAPADASAGTWEAAVSGGADQSEQAAPAEGSSGEAESE